MRNKYGREKREWKTANKSGTGAKDVNVPKILKLLNWLELYFVERDTSTNFEPTQSVELDEGGEEEEINDDFNNRSVWLRRFVHVCHCYQTKRSESTKKQREKNIISNT